MKLSSNQLEAFYQLAKDRNFTRAASNIHLTQSAVSTRILKLEEQLQLTLFTREKANIQLTPAGERLLQYCAKTLALEEELMGSLYQKDNKSLSGVIRIGGFSSILRPIVLPALSKITESHPLLGLEVHSGELSDLFPLLKNGEVDYLISANEVPSVQVTSLLLGMEINVLVEAASGSPKDIYLDHDSKDETTANYLHLKPQLLKEQIKKRYLDDIYGLIDGVSLGLGRAVLPLHMVENRKDLKILYPKTQLKIPIYLHTFASNYQTLLEKTVVEELKSAFDKALP